MKLCGQLRRGVRCMALIDERFASCEECREAFAAELERLADEAGERGKR